MIDMNHVKQRLAILADGIDLSKARGHEVFRDLVHEGFDETSVADLREIARGLGVTGPARSRDAVVENIALAWGQLDEDQRAYVEDADGVGTAVEVAGTLDDLAATLRMLNATFDAEQVRRLRDALAGMAGAVSAVAAAVSRAARQ